MVHSHANGQLLKQRPKVRRQACKRCTLARPAVPIVLGGCITFFATPLAHFNISNRCGTESNSDAFSPLFPASPVGDVFPLQHHRSDCSHLPWECMRSIRVCCALAWRGWSCSPTRSTSPPNQDAVHLTWKRRQAARDTIEACNCKLDHLVRLPPEEIKSTSIPKRNGSKCSKWRADKKRNPGWIAGHKLAS